MGAPVGALVGAEVGPLVGSLVSSSLGLPLGSGVVTVVSVGDEEGCEVVGVLEGMAVVVGAMLTEGADEGASD